jgi:NAD+ kinase
MKRVGLVVHEGRGAAVEAATALERSLVDQRVASIEALRSIDPVVTAPLDLVVSVGGDGTFLRAARIAAETGCPVLGVKVGRLGFLTEVEPEEAVAVVRRALAGQAPIEERLAVVAEPFDDDAFRPQWGLNEIMIEKHARHRLVRLAVEVDGDYVTTFSADGVIVATPTGSTAYSFSAHGPIVSPDVACLVLTPIAPHMVFDRSFVLGAGRRVSLRVLGEEPGLLSADGRVSVELAVGTRVLIRASDHPARLVRRKDERGFLTRVRDKFGLPGDPSQVDVGGDG